ncbi:hypothetical protein SDC9_125242 [bioreactor metagenome]|uniref:Uncharacterized protein n=1 Tax=bioreactor metagenome TaxID=1076179 RepID=A0A645CMR3_9ZZZZ
MIQTILGSQRINAAINRVKVKLVFIFNSVDQALCFRIIAIFNKRFCFAEINQVVQHGKVGLVRFDHDVAVGTRLLKVAFVKPIVNPCVERFVVFSRVGVNLLDEHSGIIVIFALDHLVDPEQLYTLNQNGSDKSDQ